MEWCEEMKFKIGIDIETTPQVNKYLYIIITIVWYGILLLITTVVTTCFNSIHIVLYTVIIIKIIIIDCFIINLPLVNFPWLVLNHFHYYYYYYVFQFVSYCILLLLLRLLLLIVLWLKRWMFYKII